MKNSKRKLEAAEMWFLRSVAGVTTRPENE
jgi:hypothetical protein